MARKTPAQDQPAALVLAQRLQASLKDSAYRADDPLVQPGGVVEANALFDVRGEAGEVFRVRVIRTH